MYKTAAITKQQLQAITIKNQSEIFRLMGSKLNLISAWEQIKRLSNNFKKKVTEALEADALLYAILNPNKKEKKLPKKQQINKVQIQMAIREKERARKIKILQLELEMQTKN